MRSFRAVVGHLSAVKGQAVWTGAERAVEEVVDQQVVVKRLVERDPPPVSAV